MKEIFKILAYGILASMILVIVFVRSGQLGGKNGGEQASQIINPTMTGASEIIKAATGAVG